MPEFFERRYLSQANENSGRPLSYLFLVPYTASIYKGLSGLFAMAFGIDFTWCIIGMAVLTAIYVIAGGYMATAINDFIQGLLCWWVLCGRACSTQCTRRFYGVHGAAFSCSPRAVRKWPGRSLHSLDRIPSACSALLSLQVLVPGACHDDPQILHSEE